MLSDTLLVFDEEAGDCDDAEAVVVVEVDGTEDVACALFEVDEGGWDGGGAGATTLAKERPFILWLGESVGDDLLKERESPLEASPALAAVEAVFVVDVGAATGPPPKAGNSSTESRATGGRVGGEVGFLGRCELDDEAFEAPLEPPLPPLPAPLPPELARKR